MGSNNGSGLSALVGLIGGGGINDLVAPPDGGEIPLIILGRLLDWFGGVTANEASPSDLALFSGSQDPFAVDGELGVFRDVDLRGQLLRTPVSTVLVPLPLVEDLVFQFQLDAADMRGDLSVDALGFALSDARLQGYVSRESLLGLIEGLQVACAEDRPPAICEQLGAILGEPGDPAENALPLILQFMGGFDAELTPAGPRACAGDACDAVSLCLLFESRGERVEGI